MKKYKVEQPLNINASQLVGLTAAQHALRAHCLVEVKGPALPEGVKAYEVKVPIQFKVGEVIYAADLPKNLAALVSDPDASGADSAGQGEAGKGEEPKGGKAKSGKK